MNILFLHRNFPAQFKNIVTKLAENRNNTVVFVTNNNKVSLPNIRKICYKMQKTVSKTTHSYLKFYEDSILHAQAAAVELLKLKEQGFKPDIIFGHTWGQTLFIKDIYPDVPLLCYFEWFYNSENEKFNGKELSIDDMEQQRIKNSHLLVDLYSCDYGICPTEYQKKQFPKEFHNKIEVIHDGIDTELLCPNDNATFFVKDKNITLDKNSKVVTYATRGLEPYRGFPEFMRAVETLLKIHPDLHVVVAGEDKVCYGLPLNYSTYKNQVIKELDLDLSRVHFVGNLAYYDYMSLLQISSAHVYLSYPFVCSWSLLEAMACECLIVASRTEPVEEFIKENQNGLMFDFYDIDEQIGKINFAISNKIQTDNLRKNARKTIVDNYSLNKLLPKQIEYVNKIANNKTLILNSY